MPHTEFREKMCRLRFLFKIFFLSASFFFFLSPSLGNTKLFGIEVSLIQPNLINESAFLFLVFLPPVIQVIPHHFASSLHLCHALSKIKGIVGLETNDSFCALTMDLDICHQAKMLLHLN